MKNIALTVATALNSGPVRVLVAGAYLGAMIAYAVVDSRTIAHHVLKKKAA